MEQDIAIEVKDVVKYYKSYFDKGTQLKEKLLFANRNKFERSEVLKGISFQVKKGEAIGLIGKNGCGKSTTLKLLTQIIFPNSGTIKMNGRISSLIELGAGFHQDMTGRENIYTNAAIFGLTKKEIDTRLEDIINFSELGHFIDTPVRTYSSGMYTRLAFSVAINVDADILLIDEILGVGDANFQVKCFNKLREIKANGTTIVIVSHSLSQIEQICERSIWINDGKIVSEGKPMDVHLEYLDFMNGKRKDEIEKEKQRQEKKEEAEKKEKRFGQGTVHFTEKKLVDENNNPIESFETGANVSIQLEYNVEEKLTDAVFGIEIIRTDGLLVYGTNTRTDRIENFNLEKSGKLTIDMKNVLLLPGQYWLDIAIETGDGIPVDHFKQAIRFEVYSNIFDSGLMRINHKWNLNV